MRRNTARPIAKPILPSSHAQQKKKTNLSLVIVLLTFVLVALKLTIVLFSPSPGAARPTARKLTPKVFSPLNTIPVGPEKLAIIAYVNRSDDLLVNWIAAIEAQNLPCNVGWCAPDPPRQIPGNCNVLHLPECAPNHRIHRWFHVSKLLDEGLSVMHMEPDVVMLRNPIEYFTQLFEFHPHASVFTSSDANTGIYVHSGPGGSQGGETVGNNFHSIIKRTQHIPYAGSRWTQAGYAPRTVEWFVEKEELAWRTRDFQQNELLDTLSKGYHDLGLESPDQCYPADYVMGFQVWRPGERTTNLMKKFLPVLDTKTPDAMDTWPFNTVCKTASQYCAFSDKEHINDQACGGDRLLNSVAGGTACVALLPVVQFSNGIVYSLTREHEQHGVLPFTFHASHSRNKISRIREEGLFNDPPDYFLGRFLSYTNEFTLPEPPYTWENHYQLMVQQLKLLKKALAMAKVLKRILVLPDMAAVCENFYFPGKDCVLLGHRYNLPSTQPLDHWLVKPFAQPTREPGFGRDLQVTRVSTSEAASNNENFLLITNMNDWSEFPEGFEATLEGKLNAWCCFLKDDVPMKVLYNWDGPPRIVPQSEEPERNLAIF